MEHLQTHQNVLPDLVPILIVDDNPDDADWLCIHLEQKQSFQILRSESLQETIQCIERQRVELIILDLGLPDSSGLHALFEIQKCDPRVPVIVLTGLRDDSLGRIAVKHGAQEFLHKEDISIQTLLRSISHAIERKRTQNEALVAFHDVQGILAGMPCVLIGLDEALRICLFNDMAEQLFGTSFQDVGNLPFSLFVEMQGGSGREILALLETRSVDHSAKRLLNLKFLTKDDTPVLVDVSLSKIDVAGVGAPLFLILATDVTQVRQMEMQLSLARKMESIGQLAAGIAHEINTPIQFISDNLRFLQEGFTALEEVLKAAQVCCVPDPAGPESDRLASLAGAIQMGDLDYLSREIPQALAQSLEGAERVAKIVRAMKEFSHPGSEEKKLVDVNHALETTITVARNEWKYVAEVERRFDPTLPLVPGLPGELNQVFLNLLVNAAQAIGEIIRPNSGERRWITVSTQGEAGWVEIRIADEGPGIPETIRHRIFEPFFTTKEVGKGTGQGLAIAHDVIVKKHGGQLFLQSELGEGSTFIIRLPVGEKAYGAVNSGQKRISE
jgi:signal transduction histidine kinase/FixJ family two-component response regulator